MGKVMEAGKEPRKGEVAGAGTHEDAPSSKPSAGARKAKSPSGATGSTAARVTRSSRGRKTTRALRVKAEAESAAHPNVDGGSPTEASAAMPSAPDPKSGRVKRRRIGKSVVTKLTRLASELTTPHPGSPHSHTAVAEAPGSEAATTVQPNPSHESAELERHAHAGQSEQVEATPKRTGTAIEAHPEPVRAGVAGPARDVLVQASTHVHADDMGAERTSAWVEFPSPPDRHADLRARATNAIVVGRDLLAQAAASPAVSRFLHAATGIARVLKAGLGATSAAWLDQYGKDPELERELEPVYSFLLDRYWRLQVEHADRVPAGPAVLVANHSGALPVDGPVLHHALARQRPDLREPRWLVEDQIYRAPFIGTLLNRLGAVRAAPENALRLLGEERPVIVFPEGVQGIGKRFAERYRLMRFGRGGFAKIALHTRAPIVPVAIVGAEEASPLLGKLPGVLFGVPYVPITSPVPLPSRWMIRFGEPIFLDDLPAEAAQDLEVVQDLTDRTRGSIQAMIASLLEARGSAFAR